MKPSSPPPPLHSAGPETDNDVTAATERLFLEISATFEDDSLRGLIPVINEQMFATRRYESALIPDLAAEYQVLSNCWQKRDMPRLKRLLAAYFRRREALGPQIQKLMKRPN